MKAFNYSIEKIAEIISGDITIQSPHHSSITTIITDSRKGDISDLSIFFALTTEKNDGHKYIVPLQQKGVRNFVVNTSFKIPENLHANFIRVDHCLSALQALARYHRQQFAIPVIGITGSNGKTIVKEWLFQLLHTTNDLVRSPKSYNSQIGVPLSVWQLMPNHDLAIFEAGISLPGEMEILESIIKPTIGIFTNIGDAHELGFADKTEKAMEKCTLFSDASILIYNGDDPYIKSAIAKTTSDHHIKYIDWSKKNPAAALYVNHIEKESSTTHISAVCDNRRLNITIPFIDDASIENSICCLATLLALKIDISPQILKGFATLQPIAMRLEINEGTQECTLINDSYNSDVQSLSIALDLLNQQNQRPKKTLILSDILQSNNDTEALYKVVAQLVSAKNIQKIIGIGHEIKKMSSHFHTPEKYFFDTTVQFLSQYPLSHFYNEAILIKGARPFSFEKISKMLQKKYHETIMEINLDALIHNYNYFKSLIKPSTKIMAMVKASSYGSGSYEICNALQFHNADYLAVAYADEGVTLRKSGITLPIMVMNTDSSSIDSIINYNLEPEIYSRHILSLFEQRLKKIEDQNASPLPIHLKLDTGMHRLGFEKNEIPQLIATLKMSPFFHIQSVFSHLAASDNPNRNAFTKKQISLFNEMSDTIKAAFPYPILRHILNSAGISRFPEAHMEMVRLGISLYGVSAESTTAPFLQNVSSLRSCISQVKTIHSGESVGYNQTFVADKTMEIATIAVGYADGIPRAFAQNGGAFYYKNQKVPIIGNICMDMCMVDVSGLNAHAGDIIWIFNAQHPVTDIAKTLHTIPYEVLSQISQRVKRIYFQE